MPNHNCKAKPLPIDLSSFKENINLEVPRMINIVFFPENLVGVNMKDNETSLSDGSPSPSVNSIIAGKIIYIFNINSTSNIEAAFFIKDHNFVRVRI